jgi:hypothetical protein
VASRSGFAPAMGAHRPRRSVRRSDSALWLDGNQRTPCAGRHIGLDSYDPQSEELLLSGPRPQDWGALDGVAEVSGWVNEEHVVRLLRQISTYIGYAYDDLDEAALTGALDGTDEEAADGWFDYPLTGTPPLLILLAQSPGSAVVSVRVEGTMDRVLATRIETLLDLL